jgi:hypothetical protein
MPRCLRIALFLAVFLACGSAKSRPAKEYIVAARRTGTIEFIDPVGLHTLSSITVDVSPNSAGLNGVFLNPDAHRLYVEGPIGGDPGGEHGCCWLYAIDLVTLQAKTVAGIWGTESRRAFVSDGPGFLRPVSDSANQASVVDQHVHVALPGPTESSECALHAVTNNFTIGTHLFVYEVFGSKVDRRDSCLNVSGGAWIQDATTHKTIAHFASDLYFWQLVRNHAGSELYGITSEGTLNPPPAVLVRIDSETGNVLDYQVLDSDYWWITAGRLFVAPFGNVSLPR